MIGKEERPFILFFSCELFIVAEFLIHFPIDRIFPFDGDPRMELVKNDRKSDLSPIRNYLCFKMNFVFL